MITLLLYAEAMKITIKTQNYLIFENFKSKFHRPLMRWNLLLHEWSLIFHIFVLCS